MIQIRLDNSGKFVSLGFVSDSLKNEDDRGEKRTSFEIGNSFWDLFNPNIRAKILKELLFETYFICNVFVMLNNLNLMDFKCEMHLCAESGRNKLTT